MNHYKLFSLILLSLFSISVAGQKLKSRTAYFNYKAPVEISLPDALQTYTVKLVGNISNHKQLIKDLNTKDLSIPNLKAANSEEADLELQIKTGDYKVLVDKIDSKGEGEDKRYFLKKEILIQNVSIYATQLLPKKQFIFSRHFFKDTLVFKSRGYSSPEAIKNSFNANDLDNQFNSFLFNTYASYLDMFRKHYEDYLRLSVFYIKEKETIYDQYQDLLKRITKDVFSGTIDEQLDLDKKSILKNFIDQTESLLEHIESKDLADIKEFSSGLKVNLALANLLVNDFNAYFKYYHSVSEDFSDEKRELADLAKYYQNYVSRSFSKSEVQSFLIGEWQLVDIRSRYPLDVNKDGQSNYSLVGTELPACLSNEKLIFSDNEVLNYVNISKTDCSSSEIKMCWRYYAKSNLLGNYLGLGDFYQGKCDIEDRSELYFISNHELIIARQVKLLPDSDTTEDAFLVLTKLK